MANANAPLYAFNRGLISPLGLARIDQKKTALSAQICTNFMPRVLGSMMLRPGTEYLGATNDNNQSKFLPFIFATDDLGLVELTNSTLRIWEGIGSDEAVITRNAVGTIITNGTFAGNLNGWVTSDQSGASSQWADGTAWGFSAGNYMQLAGTGFNAGIQYQEVSIAGADQATEQAVRIEVAWGVVNFRIGTSPGDDSILNNRNLGAGTHSLAFTPNTGFIYIEFRNALTTPCLVQSIAVEGAGSLSLPTPWPLSVLANPCQVRWDQSGDIVYVACQNYQPRKIMRTYGSTGPHSWSIELFQPLDGPFLLENTSATTIAASGLTGIVTLTASDNLFYSGHVGALFQLASIGQSADVSAAGTQQWSAAVQVNGIGSTERNLSISITGTWAGTVQLQMSVGSPGAWVDVSGESWTANTTANYYDGLDNQLIYYRIGIENTYASGTAKCSLTFTSGTITGTVQVTSVQSPTAATAIVLTESNPTSGTTVLSGIGSTNATANWWEGQWSDYQGWPTSLALYQGRMWMAGADAVIGSISDAYESFDQTQIGDSGPINANVGSGPVDVINWILPLQNLILGGQGSEISAVSSSFNTPLTISDFMLLYIGTEGSSAVPAVKVDYNGIFVDKTFRRVYELFFSPNYFMFNYSTRDLTNFVPDIAIAENGALLSAGGFSMIAVQRRPDTRIHAILNDGTVRVLVRDPNEDEQCWVKVQTSGIVEDVVVLPGPIEDYVYYIVNRTINGATVRYLERWAREDECWGATVSKCADCHSVYQGSSISTMQLPQLPNSSVVVWADGIPIGSADTDGSGNFTMPDGLTHSNIVAGLGYTAQFQSTKLAYAAQLGSPLSQRKRVARIGLILANAHCLGIQYGKDFDTLRDLPQVVGGVPVAANTVYTAFDEPMIEFPGSWSTDARLCLQAVAPKPVTVLAAVIDLETREAA